MDQLRNSFGLITPDAIPPHLVHQNWNAATTKYNNRDFILTHTAAVDGNLPQEELVNRRTHCIDEMGSLITYKVDLLRRFPKQVAKTIHENDMLARIG
jgi:hypothetical protein